MRYKFNFTCSKFADKFVRDSHAILQTAEEKFLDKYGVKFRSNTSYILFFRKKKFFKKQF